MTIQELNEFIPSVPDFPKKGIQFKDITPLLENPKAFGALVDHLDKACPADCTKLVAIESRGFILGAALAQKRQLGMVLVRKPGKLPREVVKEAYTLEYGTDELQMHKGAISGSDKVVIIDDVLATGGTASATEKLCFSQGAKVLKHLFLMEIEFLKGSEKLKSDSQALLQV